MREEAATHNSVSSTLTATTMEWTGLDLDAVLTLFAARLCDLPPVLSASFRPNPLSSNLSSRPRMLDSEIKTLRRLGVRGVSPVIVLGSCKAGG